MTLFHDTARSFSNCGTRVISAFGCAPAPNAETAATYAATATAMLRIIDPPSCPSDLPDLQDPSDLPDLPDPPDPPDLLDSLFEAQQTGRVLPANLLALVVGDRQRGDRVEHRRDAADLVRVVAAGEHVIGAGEVDGELQRALVEVHGVVVEVLEVTARLLLDVRAAVLERVDAAIQRLRR